MDRRPSSGGLARSRIASSRASRAPPSRSATAAPSASWRRSFRAYRTRWNDVVGGQLVGLGAVPIDDAGHRARLVDEDVGRPVVAVDPAGGHGRCSDDRADIGREPLQARDELEVRAGLPPRDDRCESRGGGDASVDPARSAIRRWHRRRSSLVQVTDGLDRGRHCAVPARIVGRRERERSTGQGGLDDEPPRPRRPVGAHRGDVRPPGPERLDAGDRPLRLGGPEKARVTRFALRDLDHELLSGAGPHHEGRDPAAALRRPLDRPAARGRSGQ